MKMENMSSNFSTGTKENIDSNLEDLSNLIKMLKEFNPPYT